jgi:hypothetical protein
LNFTVDETTSWIGYSLNGQANVTVFGNTTLVGLLFGTYSVLIYANDTYGNMGSSETVYFTVKILGDMNSDGIIDIIDIVIIALAFGSASEDDPLTPWDETLDWNPDADLNKDGLVDIVDLVMVVIQF